MTHPADRAFRLTLAGIAAAVAVECLTDVPGLWVVATTFPAVIAAIGQWRLARECEGVE